MSSHNPAIAREKRVSVEPLKTEDAKWVRLMKVTYTDPNGVLRPWEMAQRTTRPSTATIDGVDIIALLHDPRDPSTTGPLLLLQKQYRPPTDRVMIEVPAGLIDAGETPEECAVRELREETGFVGEVVGGQGVGREVLYSGRFDQTEEGEKEKIGGRHVGLFSNAGLSDACLNIVHLTIDLSRPENQNPQPCLEDNEFIETFTVPLRDLYAETRRLEAAGYGICARIGTLAEGIELGRRYAGVWGK